MSRERARSNRSRDLDFKLYVAGSGARSLRTIDSVKRACEKHVPGRYHLSIVDIYLQPEAATEAQIIAVPTLVRQRPAPVRMYVGEIPAPSALDAQLAGLARIVQTQP